MVPIALNKDTVDDERSKNLDEYDKDDYNWSQPGIDIPVLSFWLWYLYLVLLVHDLWVVVYCDWHTARFDHEGR